MGADVPQTRCAQSRAKLVTTHCLGFKPTMLEVGCAPTAALRPRAGPRLALKVLDCPDFPPSLGGELWTNVTSPRKQFL